MPGDSTIEWTEKTWNPVTGCDKVSPGCAHCYAETFAERFRGVPGHPYEQGFDLKLWPERLDWPLKWKKPSMIFVNSMSDLFHEQIPDEYIAEVFAVMATADRHTYQVLSKRPERMRDLLAGGSHRSHMFRAKVLSRISSWPVSDEVAPAPWPLPNVWLGVSIENRKWVGRADVLRGTPAAVRFISAEPLIGPLVCEGGFFARGADGRYHRDWPDGYIGDDLDLDGIDWLIVGGESGAGHRRMDPQWARGLRDRAQVTQTAFFFKQWGGARPKANGRTLDGRTWDEMPVRHGV